MTKNIGKSIRTRLLNLAKEEKQDYQDFCFSSFVISSKVINHPIQQFFIRCRGIVILLYQFSFCK